MAITLAELHERVGEMLETLPPETPVVLAENLEGDGHSPLEDVEPCKYAPETSWAGNVYGTSIGDPVGSAPEDAVDAVCLWPSR